MSYLGDFLLGSTIVVSFTTIDSTGAPATLSGTTSTTISVYPNTSTTQITAGATLTTNFDSVTGFNFVSIAATGGNGFAINSDYNIVLATGNVGGTSVAGYVIGSFSIQNRMAKLAAGEITPTTFTSGAIVATTHAAGAITSTVIAAGAIHSTTFTTAAIVATTFASGAITSTVLAAGAIHSTIFTTNAIVATTFASGAITSTVLAAGAIHSTIFTTAAIVGTTFASGSIISTTFASGAITSTVLAAGAIHSTIFTTNAITPTNVQSTVLVQANVTAWMGSAVSSSAPGIPLVNITSYIKRNATAAGFMFVMTDMTTHVPTAGLVVVGTKSIDGAAFTGLVNSATITSVGFGTYSIDLTPTDTNGQHIMMRFTNATADDLNIEIITQPN